MKRIETDGKSVTGRSRLPVVPGVNSWDDMSVLPIDNLGGAGGIRTLSLHTASLQDLGIRSQTTVGTNIHFVRKWLFLSTVYGRDLWQNL